MDKKILICTGIFPPQIGGPATYVLKMAEKISKNSIANAIITYSDQKDNEKYGLDVYRVDWTFFILTYLKYFFKVFFLTLVILYVNRDKYLKLLLKRGRRETAKSVRNHRGGNRGGVGKKRPFLQKLFPRNGG